MNTKPAFRASASRNEYYTLPQVVQYSVQVFHTTKRGRRYKLNLYLCY